MSESMTCTHQMDILSFQLALIRSRWYGNNLDKHDLKKQKFGYTTSKSLIYNADPKQYCEHMIFGHITV